MSKNTWLDGLPDDALLPVKFIREQLGDAEDVEVDLTLEGVAEKVGRSISTVRGWCSSEKLKGAYRMNGREWRIPPASLEAYLDGQREGKREPRRRDGGPVDLGSWRKHRKDVA
ncbi:helix-turn-helix domain-containing protein [Gemmatimonadota bacterium]